MKTYLPANSPRVFNILQSEGGSIKILSADGAVIDGVLLKNNTIFEGTGPLFIVNGSRMRSYYDGHTRSAPGCIRNVMVENMIAGVYVDKQEHIGVCKGVLFASGTAEKRMKNITIRNSVFLLPGGYTAEQNYKVLELGAAYPEFYRLGTTPSWGAYFRHADGITLQNTFLLNKAPDNRDRIILDDVTGFTEEYTEGAPAHIAAQPEQ